MGAIKPSLPGRIWARETSFWMADAAADFTSFKVRTPPGAIVVDLFRSLGASPTPIVYPELYMSLQTKVVDGCELPASGVETGKFYEVQKYLSATNHMPTIFWFLANQDAWNGLGPDIQKIMLRRAEEAAVLERRDIEQQDAAVKDKLRRFGMVLNTPDTTSMRAMLKPYYQRWRNEFGATAWDLLERTSGKLV